MARVRLHSEYLEVPFVFITMQDDEDWKLQDQFNNNVREYEIPDELLEKWMATQKAWSDMRKEMMEFYKNTEPVLVREIGDS